mmetsp:Transcript_14297/g.19409  ORF Transcript_14297/g.19409 Transcript_14297/m.19409 type:complete len:97 (+) Transcript_14297:131-421(+)
MASVSTTKFYGLIYEAALKLTAEDFYVPVLEALSNRLKDKSLPVPMKTRLSKAMLLLDAHVYQKLNDYNALTSTMLNFIRAAYEDLSTAALSKLVF